MPRAPADMLLDPSFLHRLERLALRAAGARTGGGRGEHRSSRVGSGVSFAGHRAYSAGDDLRFLDWRLYARSERLFLKQYEEERQLHLHLLLDCSGSMAGEAFAKLRYAQQLAAAFGYVALVQHDRVSVQPFAAGLVLRSASFQGRKHAVPLLRALAAISAGGGTDLATAARQLRARGPSHGLALVLSDGYAEDDLLRGLSTLRSAGLTPTVLLLDAPQPSWPTGAAFTLVDAETGEARTLFVDQGLLARYESAQGERRAALVARLRAEELAALRVDVGGSLERSVLALLHGRRAG